MSDPASVMPAMPVTFARSHHGSCAPEPSAGRDSVAFQRAESHTTASHRNAASSNASTGAFSRSPGSPPSQAPASLRA